jgi:hypothetical protein
MAGAGRGDRNQHLVAWHGRWAGPSIELREPTHLLSAFVYRTSWGLVLFGAIVIEGWIAEMIAPTYDAELEKTHAYELFIVLIPGLLLLSFNLVPFFKRGMEFQVHPDASVSVRRGDSCSRRRLTSRPDHAAARPGVLPRIRRAAAREGQRRVLPAATGTPGLRHRVGVGEQHQLHRYPEVTYRLSGRLDSCSW